MSIVAALGFVGPEGDVVDADGDADVVEFMHAKAPRLMVWGFQVVDFVGGLVGAMGVRSSRSSRG